VNEKKVAIKDTVKHTSKKIVRVVCADKEGHHLQKCHDKVKTAVKQHFKVVKKDTKKSLKTCACSIKATNYCSATASEKGVVQKCVITYVKSCTAQCVKRSSAITQRNEQFAAEICKQSSSLPAIILSLSTLERELKKFTNLLSKFTFSRKLE